MGDNFKLTDLEVNVLNQSNGQGDNVWYCGRYYTSKLHKLICSRYIFDCLDRLLNKIWFILNQKRYREFQKQVSQELKAEKYKDNKGDYLRSQRIWFSRKVGFLYL